MVIHWQHVPLDLFVPAVNGNVLRGRVQVISLGVDAQHVLVGLWHQLRTYCQVSQGVDVVADDAGRHWHGLLFEAEEQAGKLFAVEAHGNVWANAVQGGVIKASEHWPPEQVKDEAEDLLDELLSFIWI